MIDRALARRHERVVTADLGAAGHHWSSDDGGTLMVYPVCAPTS